MSLFDDAPKASIALMDTRTSIKAEIITTCSHALPHREHGTRHVQATVVRVDVREPVSGKASQADVVIDDLDRGVVPRRTNLLNVFTEINLIVGTRTGIDLWGVRWWGKASGGLRLVENHDSWETVTTTPAETKLKTTRRQWIMPVAIDSSSTHALLCCRVAKVHATGSDNGTYAGILHNANRRRSILFQVEWIKSAREPVLSLYDMKPVNTNGWTAKTMAVLTPDLVDWRSFLERMIRVIDATTEIQLENAGMSRF